MKQILTRVAFPESVSIPLKLPALFHIQADLGLHYPHMLAGLGGSVGGPGFDTRRGRLHSFVEIDHEIFSVVIVCLPLIQEGQLSVSGERMCTILVNCLED